jgi:23S rRNA-intervening sequence protein
MAQYEHLPIYKKAFDLTVYFEKIVRHFSRYHKYCLGTELRQLSHEVLRQIVRANNATEKTPQLEKLRELLEDLKITLRIAKEEKAFANFDSYHYSVNQVVDLCRQNEGWLKSMLPKSGRPESSSHTGVE